MSTTDEPLCDVWIDHDGQARPLTEHGRDVLAELAELDRQPSNSCAKPEPHQVNDTGYDPDCDACNAPGGPSPEHTAQHYEEAP